MTPFKRLALGLIVGLLVGITAATGTEAEAAAADTPLPTQAGDTNCNRAVDADDAQAVLRYTAGLGSPCDPAAGDVDCDGDMDSVDALHILRQVGGLAGLPACTPPVIQSRIQRAATDYWITALGPGAEVLMQARVDWTIQDTPYAGQGGVATPKGCTEYYPDYCWAALLGEGYPTWGYDWLLSVAVHEFGHLMGLDHCDYNPNPPCL